MPAVPRFWRRIPNRYNLIGVKCKSCDSIYFPPRSICPKCRRTGELEPYKLNGEGEIVSYTKVMVPPEGFEDETPYILAIIELEEGPRITAQITDVSPDEVKIGKKVEATFRHVGEEGKDGIIYYGYKFRLKDQMNSSDEK
ncbi:transcriptional regulator [candidate division MSBL1 archaeon SCGC-AAA259E19]|uniref:Transcriptional regulator n=1 Tax=candidate division MSBL1 archaeon SCGC-AAA259E19 TaxID=1698264 RepID=A0A133UN82_9EURY|nr:transcriptional regulator [candidate division MSBL1 archaeon SCGC-AAA259E19]